MVFDSSCLGWCTRGTGPMWRASRHTRKLVFLPSIDYKLGRSTSVLFALLFVGPSQITLFLDAFAKSERWVASGLRPGCFFLDVGSLSRLARLGRAYRKSVDPMFDITRFVGTRLLSSPGTRVYVIIPGNIGACEIALQRFSRLA